MTSLFENDLYMPMISLIATGTFLIHFIVITMERHVTNQREMEMINSYFVIVYSLLSLFLLQFLFSVQESIIKIRKLRIIYTILNNMRLTLKKV